MAIAEPIPEATVDEVIQRCRDVSSEIHAYVRGTASDSIGQTTSHADQKGGSLGGGLLMGGATLLGGMMGFGPLLGAAGPLLGSIVGGAGFSMGRTDTTSEQRTRGISREVLNKTAAFCETVLDRYIQRLQDGENLGLWNAGTFLLAENENTLNRAQGLVRAVLSGAETYFEPLRSIDTTAHVEVLRDALMQFRNPTIRNWAALERAFQRERGREANEEEVRRWRAMAGDALRQAETKLSLAREAEAAMAHAVERYGRSRDPYDLAEVQRWTEAAERCRREAREFRETAEDLRQRT